jgi:hypothetical protein
MGSELRGPFTDAVHAATDLVRRREVAHAIPA